jgi:DnaJ-class molecular chaperone
MEQRTYIPHARTSVCDPAREESVVCPSCDGDGSHCVDDGYGGSEYEPCRDCMGEGTIA